MMLRKPIPNTGQKDFLIWEEAKEICRGSKAAITKAMINHMKKINSLVIRTKGIKGFQHCPFADCGQMLSSCDYVIRNRETGRELWINQTTSHLAKKHHLLEKGNDYGITAAEFYEHFMLR